MASPDGLAPCSSEDRHPPPCRRVIQLEDTKAGLRITVPLPWRQREHCADPDIILMDKPFATPNKRLLANGDRWEREIAKSLALDAPVMGRTAP